MNSKFADFNADGYLDFVLDNGNFYWGSNSGYHVANPQPHLHSDLEFVYTDYIENSEYEFLWKEVTHPRGVLVDDFNAIDL